MEYKVVFFDGTTKFINIELPPDIIDGNIKAIFPNRPHQINELNNRLADKKVVSIVYINNKATIYNSKEHDGLKVYSMGADKARALGLIV